MTHMLPAVSSLLAAGVGLATVLRDRAAHARDQTALLELNSGRGALLEVSYGELLQRVREAAAVLRSKGVSAGDVVGLGLDVGAQAVVHQLASWWIGAAFVPLDAALPATRLQFLVEDAGANVVVTTDVDGAKFQGILQGAVVVLAVPTAPIVVNSPAAMDSLDGAPGVQPLWEDDELAAPCDSGDGLCHIAYTSGSTGAPKGVACRHRNLLSYCLGNAHVHGIGPGSRVLLAAAMSFDPSIGEAYTALLAGGTLVLAPRAAITSALHAVLSIAKVTHVCTTPLLWSQLQEDRSAVTTTGEQGYTSLEVVTLGGERIPRHLVKTWAEAVRLVNVYGTTEGTVYQTSHTYSTCNDNPACIGRPLPGTAVAVIRQDRPDADESTAGDSMGTYALAACDEVGELWTGGVQTAAGYHGLRLAQESSAAFLPFAALNLEDSLHTAASLQLLQSDTGLKPSSAFWYRTGDLAVWREGGKSLEVIGRADSQVKLHGVRVELGEIEENLRRCEALVAACAVCLAGDGRAVALIKLQDEAALALRQAEDIADLQWARLWGVMEQGLRLHCEAYLPRAMWPTHFLPIQLDLPLGPTHKLDRSALPQILADAMAFRDRRRTSASSEAVSSGSGSVQYPGGHDPDIRHNLDAGLLRVVAETWVEVLGLPSDHPPLHVEPFRSDFGARTKHFSPI